MRNLREPPGELIKSLISLVESWASNKRSWLIMASATKSSMLLPKKTILSLRRRPMASDSAPLMAVAGVWGAEARRREGLRLWGLGDEEEEEEMGWKHLGKDEALLREKIGKEMGLGREELGRLSLREGIGEERERTPMAD